MKNKNQYGIMSIMFGILILLCILLFRQCSATSNTKSKLNITNQNIAALRDTIRVQKNRAGELTYSIKTLLTDKRNLENLNKDLREELDKQKGKVVYITKTVTKTKVDTHYVNNNITVYGGGKFSLDWKYDSIFSPDNYRNFSGNSFFHIDSITGKITPGKTRIDNDEIGFSLVTGLREKDGSLEIFVTPKYPGMKITKIEGAVVDPKKSDLLKDMFPDKRISVGPYVGLGLGAMYHSGGKPVFGPVLNFGLGVQYSLFKF
jgi:hypothetical protein